MWFVSDMGLGAQGMDTGDSSQPSSPGIHGKGMDATAIAAISTRQIGTRNMLRIGLTRWLLRKDYSIGFHYICKLNLF